MGQIMLTLPFPPSVNTYYAVVRGRKILSKRGREYKKITHGLILEAGHSGKRLNGRLAVTVILTPPDRRGRDIDNYCKALLDALTHAEVWIDDSQVKRLVIEMMAPKKPGMVQLVITPASEPNG